MHLIKFIFTRIFFLIASLPNFKKWRDSDKLQVIFSEKRFFTTLPFSIFENKFFNRWNHWKIIFQNKIFVKKFLNWKLIDWFSKIGKSQVVEKFFLEKLYRDLLKLDHFLKFGSKRPEKKVQAKIKFINKIIFLYFKLFSWKLIVSLPKWPFNNNIAILESKIIYFCLRFNFRLWTTLSNLELYFRVEINKNQNFLVKST